MVVDYAKSTPLTLAFHRMATADVLIMSKSALSMTAAMLNANGTVIFPSCHFRRPLAHWRLRDCAPSSTVPAFKELAVDSRVLISGSRSRADLNGTHGTILSGLQQGRCAVQTAEASVRSKPKNLDGVPDVQRISRFASSATSTTTAAS